MLKKLCFLIDVISHLKKYIIHTKKKYFILSIRTLITKICTGSNNIEVHSRCYKQKKKRSYCECILTFYSYLLTFCLDFSPILFSSIFHIK